MSGTRKPMELSTPIWCTQTTNGTKTRPALQKMRPFSPAKASEVPAGSATLHAIWAHLSTA